MIINPYHQFYLSLILYLLEGEHTSNSLKVIQSLGPGLRSPNIKKLYSPKENVLLLQKVVMRNVVRYSTTITCEAYVYCYSSTIYDPIYYFLCYLLFSVFSNLLEFFFSRTYIKLTSYLEFPENTFIPLSDI